MAVERPLTQRQLRQQREAVKDTEYVIVYNKSRQLLKLQVTRRSKPGHKKLDFYFSQQTVELLPKATVKLVKEEVMLDQLHNLAKKGYLKILTESAKE